MKICRLSLISLFALFFMVVSSAHAQITIEGTGSYHATYTSHSISLKTKFQYISNYNYADSPSLKLVVSCLKSSYNGGSAIGRTVVKKHLGIIPARTYFKNVTANGSATYSGKCFVTAFLVDGSNTIYYGHSFTKSVNVKRLNVTAKKLIPDGRYSEEF